MLIRKKNQKSAIFVTVVVAFLDKGFKFQPDVCNWCCETFMVLIIVVLLA